MEVRIKQGDEMLDATIEMVDGVMVVSPKAEKFEPKDGDVVSVNSGSHIFICKNYIGDGILYAYIGLDFEFNRFFEEGKWSASRFATEEEKKLFFDKLKEKGYEWDAEKRELVKLKWKPEIGQVFWTPLLDPTRLFQPFDLTWRGQRERLAILKRDWVFKTKEECQVFCDKLNAVINQVKP